MDDLYEPAHALYQNLASSINSHDNREELEKKIEAEKSSLIFRQKLCSTPEKKYKIEVLEYLQENLDYFVKMHYCVLR